MIIGLDTYHTATFVHALVEDLCSEHMQREGFKLLPGILNNKESVKYTMEYTFLDSKANESHI